jgi:hypothetical protein
VFVKGVKGGTMRRGDVTKEQEKRRWKVAPREEEMWRRRRRGIESHRKADLETSSPPIESSSVWSIKSNPEVKFLPAARGERKRKDGKDGRKEERKGWRKQGARGAKA